MNAKTRATLPDWLLELLQCLDDELVLRGYARQTRSLYWAHVRRFYAGRTGADQVATDEEVRAWMLDVLRSGLSHSYANQALSALARRFLEELGSPKHRAIAFVLYSAGLRVGEVVRLRVEDINSQRGQIHVRQAKGGKDRCAILSPVVLGVLREYVRIDRSPHWLFPGGKRRDKHITTRTIQKQVSRAGKKAGIRKRVTPHMLRQALRPISWRAERT